MVMPESENLSGGQNSFYKQGSSMQDLLPVHEEGSAQGADVNNSAIYIFSNYSKYQQRR